MGQIKNIKLHIVTDIRRKQSEMSAGTPAEFPKAEVAKPRAKPQLCNLMQRTGKSEFFIGFVVSSLAALWWTYKIYLPQRRKYFEFAENYDHKYTEGFDFSMIPKEAEDDDDDE